MKLFKYNQFLNSTPINENLDKAKKFLKERYLLLTAATETGLLKGELKAQIDHKEIRSITLNDFSPEEQVELKKKLREMKLTDEQVRNLERDPEFLKIRELLGSNLGYVYPFTYFYYVENIPFKDLEDAYKKLTTLKDLLPKMPKKFDANFIDVNSKKNFETLVDGFNFIEKYKKVKKIYDKLTPELKKDYNDSPPIIKERFDEVAVAFEDFGMKDDGTFDEAKRDNIQRAFFGEVRRNEKGEMEFRSAIKRYKDIRAFIKSAQDHLKASLNDNVVAFYDKIHKCNDKYGKLGADVVFDSNGILVLEVNSFPANQMLNGNTSHCIKDSLSQWDSYIPNKNGVQYYIYNFNIGYGIDNKSIIGITIVPGRGDNKYYACHDKVDSSISCSNFKSLIKKWEKEYNLDTDLWDVVFVPISDEELKRRERAKTANREIVKKGISAEEVIRLVKEEGADVNQGNGAALENAVIEDNLEKAKALLEFGASPNLKKGQDVIISKARNWEMVKLLVSYGSELNGEVFRGICGNMEAIEFVLKNGLDPNFSNSMPIRMAIRGSYVNANNTGKAYTDVIKHLVKNGAKISDDKDMTVRWAAEYGRLDVIDYMIQNGLRSGFSRAKSWIKSTCKVSKEETEKINKYLDEKIKQFETK